MKTLFTTCFLLIICCAEPVHAQAPKPTLLAEENSQRAGTIDALTLLRDPLPVVPGVNVINPNPFDWRTRLSLFGTNLDLLPGETASAVTASARDLQSKTFSLKVEFVGKVQGLDSLTQVIVKLPDALAQAGDVWISVSLRGQTSNEVLVRIAVQTEPRLATLVARRVNNGVDNYVDATFSFEFGRNGKETLLVNRNDWDILFGNSPDHDDFQVSMVGDDRSRMQDMGALNWSDSFQVPVLPAYPLPTIDPSVPAVVGHMYVVHTKDTETDLYFLFRVEAIESKKSVTISWKSVRSPE